MSRVQLAINVEELDAAIEFYSKLFATEPAKVRPGYANFAIAEPPLKLVLIETPGQGGTLNHLGVEVASTEEVVAAQARLAGEGLTTASEEGVACCYARQDKVWVDGPSGEPWEIYTVLEDVEMPGGQLRTVDPEIGRHLLRRRWTTTARSCPTPPPTAADPPAVSDLAHQPETGTGALQLNLARRLLAEALGTGLLVMAVIGSGIMASRLSPDDVGLQLLENAAATAGALVALIWMLGARLRRPPQPRRHRARSSLRRHLQPGAPALHRRPGGRRLPRRHRRQPDVRAPRRRPVDHDPFLRRPVAVRGGRHGRALARHPRLRSERPSQRRRCRRRCVDRWRLLLHVLDQLRQPGRHHRPHPLRHLRRHRTLVGTDVHSDATRRRFGRLRALRVLFPIHMQASNELRPANPSSYRRIHKNR